MLKLYLTKGAYFFKKTAVISLLTVILETISCNIFDIMKIITSNQYCTLMFNTSDYYFLYR